MSADVSAGPPREEISEATVRPVVLKFGGSSLADLDRVRAVAKRVVERSRSVPVVVVVSAMGKTTNELVAKAHALCESPPSREMDMLLTTGERMSMSLMAMAIASHGARVVSLTGSQCGIITDHRHGQARVIEVRPFRIWDELAGGHIVIVGGFQGVSYRRDVTTIGRGGSDTTAVALAAALGGDCEIYSDVDGVYSADPREVPDARRIDELGYQEMQALSRAGARVLHAQAVQLAEQRGIAIYARRTDGEGGETVVRKNPAREPGVHAVTSDAAVTLLRATAPTGWRCPPGGVATLGAFGLLYLRLDHAGLNAVLPHGRRPDATALLEDLGRKAADLGLEKLDRRECALVCCVGSGLEERPDLVEQAGQTLDAAGIAPLAFMTDANTLAFVVESGQRDEATRELHAALVTDQVAPTRE